MSGMNVVILILLAGTLGALGAAGYCYTVALTEARRHFPLEFQDEHSSRYALDTDLEPPRARERAAQISLVAELRLDCHRLP
jgi:hypothetical protein